jgi:hypothetical protein
MRPSASLNINLADASVNQSGSGVSAAQVFYASAQATVTGASTGTLYIQASNDIAPPVNSSGVAVPTNWTNIGTTAQVTISGSGTFLIPKFDVCYQFIRSSYVKNNGSAGAVSVIIKTLGA